MPTFNPTNASGSTGTVQTWVVPASGTYEIEAKGARGGRGENAAYGKGATIKATFTLTAGHTISIIVGQQPVWTTTTGNYGGGGGGGTFVVNTTTSTPLLVAAGGNGGNWGSFTSQPAHGQWTPYNSTQATTTSTGRAGSGGTYSINGPNGPGGTAESGGQSFTNGGVGGAGIYNSGGFGGGGGARFEGGGAGGWVGGCGPAENAYTQVGNSAYSYSAGTGTTGTSGTVDSSGLVTITQLNSAPVATITSPTEGANVNSMVSQRVSWNYSDADANVQTQYEIGWQLNGGAWNASTVTSALSYHDFAADTFIEDGNYAVRVRVSDGVAWSSYSTKNFVVSTWTTLTEVNSSAPSGYIDAAALAAGNYDIRVRTSDVSGYGPWSSVKAVTLAPGTNVYVKSGGTFAAKTNWVKVGGIWKQVPPTKRKSGGAFN